ncbi:hypothetical protein Aduo_018854 [Ancylostoma duodenale]
MSSSTQTSTLKTAKAKLTRQLSTLNKLIQEGDHKSVQNEIAKKEFDSGKRGKWQNFWKIFRRLSKEESN